MSKTRTKQNGLIYASREEIDWTKLEILEGKIPEEIYGTVYFNSPVGTVSSNGLPYRKNFSSGNRQEFGSPVFNGDGMLIAIQFGKKTEESKAEFKTALIKTPCYYADLYTSKNWKKIGFFNAGISRLSLSLGVRNQLNTALLPFRYSDEKEDRILATFDTGRPYEFDPLTLELKHPVGNNLDWEREFSGVMNYVFPMIQTTAHPSFDPETQEFFAVNFTKKLGELMRPRKAIAYFINLPPNSIAADLYYLRLLALADEGLDAIDNPPNDDDQPEIYRERFIQLLDEIDEELTPEDLGDELLDFTDPTNDAIKFPKNNVFLLRRDGQNKISTWRVLDQNKKPITVAESLHQTGITKDYFIFIDTAFKISLELLLHNPACNSDKINRFIRELTKSKLKQYTDIYIVKRSDLKVGQDTVIAKRVHIDIETVHFAIDYDNPNETITMHCAHNQTLCAAEWIRPFDKIYLDSTKKPDESTIGLPTIGEMDVSKIGKLEIHVPSGKPKHSCITTALDLKDIENQKYGPNTWGIGLMTYPAAQSPSQTVSKINMIFWQFYGLDKQFLTEYLVKLYEGRKTDISTDDLLKYTKAGIPFSIARQDVSSMKLTDSYIFPKDYHFRSLQYVPSRVTNDEENGFLVCTVITPIANTSPKNYQREIWIFNAQNLNQGPICRLTHPKLSFAFTIHSAWLPNPVNHEDKFPYDIRKDFNDLLSEFSKPQKAKWVKEFMEAQIYGRFEKKK